MNCWRKLCRRVNMLCPAEEITFLVEKKRENCLSLARQAVQSGSRGRTLLSDATAKKAMIVRQKCVSKGMFATPRHTHTYGRREPGILTFDHEATPRVHQQATHTSGHNRVKGFPCRATEARERQAKTEKVRRIMRSNFLHSLPVIKAFQTAMSASGETKSRAGPAAQPVKG